MLGLCLGDFFFFVFLFDIDFYFLEWKREGQQS